jgi:hypothetical protein
MGHGAGLTDQEADGVPARQELARPCVAHIRVHVGELETLAQLL